MATEKRLIDADDALEQLKQAEKEMKFSTLLGCKAVDIKAVLKYIESRPTVDAVEVVRGRWVIEKRHTVSRNHYMDDNYHAHATCSECGFCIHSENASFGYPELNTTNYCPNCGADMRERKDNE